MLLETRAKIKMKTKLVIFLVNNNRKVIDFENEENIENKNKIIRIETIEKKEKDIR